MEQKDTGEAISENDYQKAGAQYSDEKMARLQSYVTYGAIGLVTAAFIYFAGIKPLIDFNKNHNTPNIEEKILLKNVYEDKCLDKTEGIEKFRGK